MSFHERLRIDLGLLWPLIILASLTFYISLVPLPPNDFWWHLKIGELIHTTGSIPNTNLFAWTLPADAPFTYGAWLGEYLLYRLYSWGDLPLVLFARTLLATLTFALVGYEARRRSGSWRLAALAIAFAGGMSLNNLIVRPQIWSWVPFMVFYILLSRYTDGDLPRRWLLLCPVLMMFWVNAHGAFVLGPALLGIFLMGESLRRLLSVLGALRWKEIGWLGVILLLSLVATSVNPQFVGIYGYVFDLMTDRPSQGLVVEWQSPTPNGIANVVFFVSIVAFLLVLAYARRRPTPTEALLLVGFLWLAFSGQRYVVWYGMIAVPLLIETLGTLIPARYVQASGPKNWVNLLLALLLWVPVLLVQPWFVESVPLPDTYWERVWRGVDVGPLVDVETPVRAVQYLQEHPGGRLFNEMGYGSYLIWAVPEQGVFVDPRVELYPLEMWEDYIRISNGVRSLELLNEYGANRVLLDRENQEELARALSSAPEWEREYQDDYSEIWRKFGSW
jgi:hypothetical protein